jgi:type IV pilus assembly protein PilA
MFTGKTDSKKQLGAAAQHGFSLIELLVVVAIILIIAAIAIPSLLSSRIAANEAAAAVTVRTITTAAMTYSSTYGNGFPPNLATLGGPLTTAPNTKSGFTFAFTPVGAADPSPVGCAMPGEEAYLVTATPVSENLTGIRSFCSDEPGTIHYDTTGTTAATQSACETLPALQ